MPIHDWTRVEPQVFHDFHQAWIFEIRNALHSGILPVGYSASVDYRFGVMKSDVISMQAEEPAEDDQRPHSALSIGPAPPRTHIVTHQANDAHLCARRASRLVVRNRLDELVAVLEVVSPGNKDSRATMRAFVNKACDLLQTGVHLTIVDLFPPTERDPLGIHKVIWDEIGNGKYDPPRGMNLTLASYSSGSLLTAYVEPTAIGELLFDMPLFLESHRYVAVPLSATYNTILASFPESIRRRLGA